MNKPKDLSSRMNVITGIEPWKVELLWSYMSDLTEKVDSVLNSGKWGFHSTLSEGSAYTKAGSQGMALKIHEGRIRLIHEFLKSEIEKGNIRIEDGGIKSPESLQRKKKRMKRTNDPETYLRDLSRLRVICKDIPTLLTVLKRFCLYVSYANPGNLFLSRGSHRYSPSARPTFFPSIYLYLGEFSSGNIPILEQQLDALKKKRDNESGWQSWIEPETEEWKKTETRWNALQKRIERLESQIKNELQKLNAQGVSTEVQFMTEEVRAVAESNREDYVANQTGEVKDFTDYNRQMIEAVLKDISKFQETQK